MCAAMKRLTGLVLGLAAAALIGCGDSSVECGTGTAENDDGFCVPTGEDPPNCGDGTMLDTASNTCVIDPNSCQNGTVLIDGACVDPTEGLEADVTEAAEPNAGGFFGEPSEFIAGRTFARFEPSAERRQAELDLAGWRRAVRAALSWARDSR